MTTTDSATSKFCAECGDEFFLTDSGVAHHVSDENKDGIDYDADADHVAVDEDAFQFYFASPK